MYGNESREDGEIKFHYNREEMRRHTGEEEQKGTLWRLFRLNRSSLIILFDILLLTVVFMIFKPMLVRNDHVFENDEYTARLSGFLFNEKAYVNIKITARKDNPGGEVNLRVWSGEAGAKVVSTDTVPENEGVEKAVRLEMLADEGSPEVFAEVLLPGMDKPALLTAILKE